VVSAPGPPIGDFFPKTKIGKFGTPRRDFPGPQQRAWIDLLRAEQANAGLARCYRPDARGSSTGEFRRQHNPI
jgi:hypothetical protein